MTIFIFELIHTECVHYMTRRSLLVIIALTVISLRQFYLIYLIKNLYEKLNTEFEGEISLHDCQEILAQLFPLQEALGVMYM